MAASALFPDDWPTRDVDTAPGIRIHVRTGGDAKAPPIDLEHDRADRDAGRKLAMPLLALWGEHGIIHRCFRPLDEWRRVASDVQGQPLPCGHYIPEEAPAELLDKALPFLRAAAGS